MYSEWTLNKLVGATGFGAVAARAATNRKPSLRVRRERSERIGWSDWIRTSDPLRPRQVRYQAALRPDPNADATALTGVFGESPSSRGRGAPIARAVVPPPPRPAMHFLVYVSPATRAFSEPELRDLLAVSRANSAARDLTGVLLYKD